MKRRSVRTKQRLNGNLLNRLIENNVPDYKNDLRITHDKFNLFLELLIPRMSEKDTRIREFV